MLSNLLYYGFAGGFGIAAAVAFSLREQRHPFLILFAIFLSCFWYYTSRVSYPYPIDSLHHFLAVFDIERLLAIHQGKRAAVLFILPLFCSFSVASVLLIEARQLAARFRNPHR